MSDAQLRDIVQQLESGRIGTDLGGGVYKIRVAQPGKGKAGGYRVIIFFKSEFRSFFEYGFKKSDLANISDTDQEDFKKLAKYLFSLNEEEMKKKVTTGEYKEI
ncbi:addiction module toxin RelE [Spirochaetia bacterium]|nr:addiction module toxin RelE [Spirochaetia bacterium]